MGDNSIHGVNGLSGVNSDSYSISKKNVEAEEKKTDLVQTNENELISLETVDIPKLKGIIPKGIYYLFSGTESAFDQARAAGIAKLNPEEAEKLDAENLAAEERTQNFTLGTLTLVADKIDEMKTLHGVLKETLLNGLSEENLLYEEVDADGNNIKVYRGKDSILTNGLYQRNIVVIEKPEPEPVPEEPEEYPTEIDYLYNINSEQKNKTPKDADQRTTVLIGNGSLTAYQDRIDGRTIGEIVKENYNINEDDSLYGEFCKEIIDANRDKLKIEETDNWAEYGNYKLEDAFNKEDEHSLIYVPTHSHETVESRIIGIDERYENKTPNVVTYEVHGDKSVTLTSDKDTINKAIAEHYGVRIGSVGFEYLFNKVVYDESNDEIFKNGGTDRLENARMNQETGSLNGKELHFPQVNMQFVSYGAKATDDANYGDKKTGNEYFRFDMKNGKVEDTNIMKSNLVKATKALINEKEPETNPADYITDQMLGYYYYPNTDTPLNIKDENGGYKEQVMARDIKSAIINSNPNLFNEDGTLKVAYNKALDMVDNLILPEILYNMGEKTPTSKGDDKPTPTPCPPEPPVPPDPDPIINPEPNPEPKPNPGPMPEPDCGPESSETSDYKGIID